jgi:hypothetical protein
VEISVGIEAASAATLDDGMRVVDGLAKSAARQITAGLLEEDQSTMQALVDRTTLAAAHGVAFSWTGLSAAQVLLDAVEMSDLAQEPSATLRGLFARLVEVAPGGPNIPPE